MEKYYIILFGIFYLFVCEIIVLAEERIIRGTDAMAGEFPGIVNLEMVQSDGGISMCGGTLIDMSHILTAAHCLYEIYPAEV